MMISFFIITLFGYGAIAATMYAVQDRLVFFPDKQLSGDPQQWGMNFEEVWLTATDGVRSHAWYVPASSPTARTVLFLHGNGGNISHRPQTIALYHQLGLNILILDYRGYGRSEGKPSETGTLLDASAAWRHLRDERSIDAAAILIHGRSLGGGVALALADQLTQNDIDFAALFVESTFTSIADVGAEKYPWLPVRLLSRIHYPNKQRIATIKVPVLIAHGPGDELIPFHHGKGLHAVAPTGSVFLQMQGGHNDGFIVTGQPYVESLAQFVNAHLGSK